jgi:hypothetical protein
MMKGHDPILSAEDDKLEELNAQTERWWYEMRSRMTVDSVVSSYKEKRVRRERAVSRIFTYSERCAIIDFGPMGGLSRTTILSLERSKGNGGKFRCENKNPEPPKAMSRHLPVSQSHLKVDG